MPQRHPNSFGQLLVGFLSPVDREVRCKVIRGAESSILLPNIKHFLLDAHDNDSRN